MKSMTPQHSKPKHPAPVGRYAKQDWEELTFDASQVQIIGAASFALLEDSYTFVNSRLQSIKDRKKRGRFGNVSEQLAIDELNRIGDFLLEKMHLVGKREALAKMDTANATETSELPLSVLIGAAHEGTAICEVTRQKTPRGFSDILLSCRRAYNSLMR